MIATLIATPWKQRVAFTKERLGYIAVFIGFYLSYIIATLYSADTGQAVRQLELKVTLFLMPLVMLGSNVVNRFNVHSILKTYVVGATLAATYCLLYAVVHYVKTGDSSVFYYSYFSVYHHTSYFALYLNMAIAFLMLFIFHSKEKVPKWYYVSLLILIVSVYQSASRAGIFTLIILLVYLVGFITLPKLKWRRTLLYVLFVIGTAMLVIVPGNKMKGRMEEAFRAMDQENVQKESSSAIRILMWKSAFHLIKEQPVLGYGTGDGKEKLLEQFEKDGLTKAYTNDYNPHNQYLQTWVTAGLLGVITLILTFLVPGFVALRKGSMFYPLYAFLLSTNLLTESMLERQGGVMFMAIFGTLLFFTVYRKKPVNV